MSDYIDLNKKVLREYEKMRSDRETAVLKQTEELYTRLPEIKYIDDKIASLSVYHATRILTEGITPEEAVEAVNSEKAELLERRALALSNASYTVYEIPYNCCKCKDTGVYNNQKCSCYMNLLNKFIYGNVDGSKELSFNFENDKFENFELKWYSEITDKNLGVSPYEIMKKTYADCILFCNNFDTEFKNLYFYGGTGTGKTFMANCIANDLIAKGFSVVYQSAYKLCQFMEDYKFGRIEREANANLFESIYNADLLIIDDLGTEFSTAYTCSVIFDILNTRFINRKSTIISSNLSLSNITKKYTDRVASRIMGYFELMHFMGEDIRIAKKKIGENYDNGR